MIEEITIERIFACVFVIIFLIIMVYFLYKEYMEMKKEDKRNG